MSINFIFNLSKIDSLKDYMLSANNQEKIDLSELLEVLEINKLDCKIDLVKIDNKKFLFNCVIDTIFFQECAVSGESLKINKEINFNRIIEIKNNISYADEISNLEDDNIYLISNYNLCIKDIILEEMILNIDPYIKKEN